MNRWISAAVLMGTLTTSSQAMAGDYAISNSDTLLYIKVYKDPETHAAGISHDHAIRAATVSGSVSWDAANPGACSVNITVPVNSLTADEYWLRRVAGLEGRLDDGTREVVKRNMLSVGQLNAGAHPNITFQSTSCTDSSISGNLTIRGQSQAVTMNASFADHDGGVKISGSLSITASQFGFEPYSAMFGQIKNRDSMDLKGKVVAK